MTNHQFSRTLKTATIPLRLLVVLGMLLGMLGTLVPASPVGASSVTSAQFNGGTGTVTVNGTVFAKKGGALTLTVVTTSDTNCVVVTGDPSGSQTQRVNGSGKSTWSFPFTAGAGDGPITVTATAFNKVNQNEVCGGASASLTASYTLDNTGPAVTASLAPTPTAGWNNSNVTITWTASDAGSGVASVTPATDSVTADGTVVKTATATDRLGNPGSGSVTVNLDKTAPTIAGAQSPAANANGWNNGNVTVSFTCSDATSGIKSCSGPTTLSGEGANQQVTGTATDNAGNTNTATVGGINIDKTPPTLSGAPTAGPSGTDANGVAWYKDNVAIAWTCSDALSGIAGGCPANGTITGEGKGLTTSASASDKAGNTTTTASAAVNIDRTVPTTSATAPSPANWNNTNVTVTLSASDALSGVKATHYSLDGGATQTGTSVVIASDGVHTLQFWSEDYAGNVEQAKSVQVKIDQTPPTINHTQSPAANGNGWNNTDVTVTFTCADATSGVASCTAPQTVTTESADQPVTGTATDNAGNTATDPAKVSIDKTPPTIGGAATAPPNANGWYNGDVTVGFTCDDALSGVASCQAPVTVTTEGTNQSVTGTAKDAAGNSASTTYGGINVDKTPPTLNGTPSGPTNGSGWYTGDVTVTWACGDALSGIASCPSPSTVTGEGGNLSATGTATDKAGNATSTTVSGIKIDRTAPSTAASVAGTLFSGWYAGPVTVTLTANDNLSGVAQTYYSVDGGAPHPYKGSFAFDQGGTHTLTFWSVDTAGNTENQTAPGHSLTLQVDKTPPTITGAVSAQPNGNGWYNAPVMVSFTCADNETGIADCPAPVIVAGPGKNLAVTGTATDNAGNTNSATVGGINIDLAAPTLAGVATTQPNAAGWYTGNVTIHWAGTDELSGIDPATQPADSVITGEGSNLGAGPVTVSDLAGNVSAPASVSGIKIDRRPPQISGAATTQPNAAGWYNASVTVHFTCADPALADGSAGSGVAQCPSDQVLSANGADQGASGSATDVAGNTSAPFTVGGINIDALPPQTTAALSCTGSNGWCRGQTATVVLTATDQTGLSGVKEIHYTVNGGQEKVASGASVSVTVPLAAQSGAATVKYYAVDNAGNLEAQSGVSLLYDNLAPTITHAQSPAANGAGWTNADTTVQFIAVDDPGGSGVDVSTVACGSGGTVGPVAADGSVTCSATVSAETPAGGLTVNAQAADKAGNVGSDAAVVKLDKTPPTIGGAPTTKPNGNGWYNGPVTVAFACSDALSGVASCQAPITVTTDGANQTVTGVATDIAGNRATAPVGGINIDTAPPTISGKATTAPNGNGWYNGPVAIHFTCSDALSGIQQCPADVVLNKAGANQAVSGTAVDNAGNAATYTVSGINIDLTSPTLTGAAATPANAAGWYNTDVTINWTGTDDLAGIDPATQPAASVITGEGSNLGASAKIADKAGNVGTGTVGGIKIDRTPPTISGAPTTQPNAAGWYKGAVTVHFTCADPALADGTPGSGVAQCPSDQVLSADGADQGVASGPAADVAGNSSTGITVKGINIDTQAPQTTAALSCTGSNGWCRGSSATVVLTAADQPGLSGVKEIHYSVNGGQEQVADGASVTVTVPLDATSGQATITYHAVDKAGNTEAPAGASINYDNIAPTVTPTLSPAANAAGWSNATTTVHFTAVDNPGGSGVDPTSVTPDVTVSAETAGQVVTGQAQDYAGNVGTTSVTVELDMTAPTITGAATTSANKAGWYNGPVTVHFTCSDALSGIATCPADVILTANGANQAVTGTAQDVAGNTATYTVSGINIDTAVPTITVSGVANGATYTLGAVPTPACSATDSGGSGLTGPCTGTLSGGTPNGVGSYTYTATASDAAGNTATVTVKYRVIYRFDGFLQPINDTAHQTGLQTSVFKGGSTVPAKFQLKDAAGNIVQANSLPIWLAPAQGSSTAAPVDETVYSDPVDTASTYRWDSTGQQYIFNWGTKGFAAGNYWRIGVQLDDGQIYYVNLGLR